jgi:hypothetical protein
VIVDALKARLIGLALAIAIVAAGGLYVWRLQVTAAKAKPKIEAAQAQTRVEKTTAQAIDRVIITERRITDEVRYATKTIDELPSGGALVPGDVASAWASGIDSLRDGTAQPGGGDPGQLEKPAAESPP